MKLTIGQVLYEPPCSWRSYWREHKVDGIGRKWVKLDTDRRCTTDTLLLDCSRYAPIQLYADRKTYEDIEAIKSAWFELRKSIEYNKPPSGVTSETIAQVRVMLGL